MVVNWKFCSTLSHPLATSTSLPPSDPSPHLHPPPYPPLVRSYLQLMWLLWLHKKPHVDIPGDQALCKHTRPHQIARQGRTGLQWGHRGGLGRTGRNSRIRMDFTFTTKMSGHPCSSSLCQTASGFTLWQIKCPVKLSLSKKAYLCTSRMVQYFHINVFPLSSSYCPISLKSFRANICGSLG